MAFVQLESWKAAAPESRLHPFGRAAFTLPAGLALPSRRAAAGLFTILVHCALLWFLVARLSDGTAADPLKQDVLAVFNVAPLGETESKPAARLETAVVAPPAAPVTVDLSQAADLPAPEWTMARMPARRAAASPAAMASAGSAAGQGGGRKGEARLSQFVGFGDGIGGEMLLDRNMLEIARRAAMRAFPDARGTALIFLRVSPSGTVMSAMVKGGSRDIGLALRRELMGKKLFQMRSVIGESALVALPPVSLGADS